MIALTSSLQVLDTLNNSVTYPSQDIHKKICVFQYGNNNCTDIHVAIYMYVFAKLWLICFCITAAHSEDPARLPVPPQPTSPPLHPSLHHLSHSSSSSPSPPPQFTMAQLPSQPPPSQNPTETLTNNVYGLHGDITQRSHDQGDITQRSHDQGDITHRSHDQDDITHRSHDQDDNTEADPEMARLERQLDTWCLELKRNVLVRFQHAHTHTHTLPLVCSDMYILFLTLSYKL